MWLKCIDSWLHVYSRQFILANRELSGTVTFYHWKAIDNWILAVVLDHMKFKTSNHCSEIPDTNELSHLK